MNEKVVVLSNTSKFAVGNVFEDVPLILPALIVNAVNDVYVPPVVIPNSCSTDKSIAKSKVLFKVP